MKETDTTNNTNNNNNNIKPIYDIIIDFEDASKQWRANKKSIGNGSFKYICTKLGKNNNHCVCRCLPGEDFCKTHYKMHKKQDTLS
jgi:hypothetical protein